MPSASWSPGKASGVSSSSKAGEDQCTSSSPQAEREGKGKSGVCVCVCVYAKQVSPSSAFCFQVGPSWII